MEYKYEAETFEIAEIFRDIEALQKRISNFHDEIDTDDVISMETQIKRLKDTAGRVVEHMKSLNTQEELEAYCEKQNEKQMAEHVAELLQGTNFLEFVEMNQKHITNEELTAFQTYYNIRLHEEGYGTWRWLALHDLEGNPIKTQEDFEKFGIRPPKGQQAEMPDVQPEKEPDTSEAEETKDHPYDHFGWVLADGSFHPSDWGTHESSASQIIKDMGCEQEYDDWVRWGGVNGMRLCRDFLVYAKNAVLLHRPSGYGPVIATHARKPTKAQRETLYDYFIHRNDHFAANQYFEEETELEL